MVKLSTQWIIFLYHEESKGRRAVAGHRIKGQGRILLPCPFAMGVPLFLSLIHISPIYIAKRASWYWQPISMVVCTIGLQKHKYREKIKKGLLIMPMAVSYTHLDVYKRQFKRRYAGVGV